MLRVLCGLLMTGLLVMPAAAQENGGTATEFKQKFEQWVTLLNRLREIQAQYKVAEPENRSPLETEFNTKLKQAEELFPQLEAEALSAYKSAPNDPRISEFVQGLARKYYYEGHYEKTIEMADQIIANKPEDAEIYMVAGQAAFELTQLDKAESYLNTAKAEMAKQEKEFPGEQFLNEISQEREIWEAEQKARERDAKPQGDPMALPRVKLETTKGDVVIELFENDAPNTVAHFITLAEDGFYDGVIFHRVIRNFMAQTGDPEGTGQGGPGYNIPCECYKPDARKHFRGSVAMAHAGRDTGGSQFYITFKPTRHLDGKHTVFGREIEGMDVVDAIHKRTPDQPGTKEADKILKATVLNKRDHDYTFRKVGDPEPKQESTEPPASDKPADDKPADNKPADDKPADEKPANDEQPPQENQ